jgi:hypothetical protein
MNSRMSTAGIVPLASAILIRAAYSAGFKRTLILISRFLSSNIQVLLSMYTWHLLRALCC